MLMRFYAAIGVPMDATRLLVNSMGCEQCRPKYREAVREYMNAHAEHMCEECMRPRRDQPAARLRLQKPRLRRGHGGRSEDLGLPVR